MTTKGLYYHAAFKTAASELLDGLNGLEIDSIEDARRLLRAEPSTLVSVHERLVLAPERVEESVNAYASMQALLMTEASDLDDLRSRLKATIERCQRRINRYYGIN